MTITLVLASQDRRVVEALSDLVDDQDDLSVRAVASSPTALRAVALDHEPDVVLLDETFGPAPALTVARDLVERLPWLSIVLLTREPTLDLSALAADAGVRSLLRWPVSLTDLTARVTAAARLSRTIRTGSEARTDTDEPGTMLTLAGAKGGVGTTTVATQLAFVAAAVRDRRVCLVDLDLFGGDLAGYVGCGPSRSILDLRDVSDELNPGLLQPLLYPHESGVRMLFAPDQMADGELVTESLVRRTLGVLRAMFDVVLVDVGARMTESALPAVELAERIVVVATPDLTSLRHGHRLIEGWESVDVRPREVELLLNQVHRNAAVQPRLAAQVSSLPVGRVTLPTAGVAAERLANEGASGLKNARSISKPLEELAAHLDLVPPKQSWFAPLWRRRSDRGDPTPEDRRDRHRAPVSDLVADEHGKHLAAPAESEAPAATTTDAPAEAGSHAAGPR